MINTIDLAKSKQDREIKELSDKFNKLAESVFSKITEEKLSIFHVDIFITKHLMMLWLQKRNDYLATKEVKELF